MPHEDYEAEIAHGALRAVVSAVPSPVCLVGGWAVYYTVNANYTVSTGEAYHGSKDIDLGFHLEADATGEELRESALARAVESLRDAGFRSMGVRLFKDYHRETRFPLPEARAKRTPSYNIFQLYVDFLVDNAPAGTREAAGIRPFDEVHLAHVFGGKMFKAIDGLSARVIVPTPPVLLAMKAASLPARTKDYKKHKDVMDVYALIWHSGVPTGNLRRDVSRLVSGEGLHRMLSSIGKSDYEQAAAALGADAGQMEAVIGDFVRGPRAAVAAGGRGRGKWPVPSGVSYDRLVAAVKALGQEGAGQGPVGIEAVSRTAGIGSAALRQGLSFLESVGVAEMPEPGRCSLTAAGVPYSKAHLDGDARQVRALTRDIIGRSHLADLADAIKAGSGLTRDDLCKRIKEFGGYPDGRGGAVMRGPAAAGAAAVLRLFEDAGLLGKAPTSAAGGAAAAKRQQSGGSGGERSRSGKTPEAPSAPSGADGMGDQAVLAVKGVGEVRVNDQETLRVAEMYMDILRKRLSRGSAPGGAARGSGG